MHRVCHSHVCVTHLLLPPWLPSVPAPLLKTLPPSPSSIPPIHQSIHPSEVASQPYLVEKCTPQNLCKEKEQEGRRCRLLSTHWLPESTERDPHCIAAFFDDLFIAWQPVSSKKQW